MSASGYGIMSGIGQGIGTMGGALIQANSQEERLQQQRMLAEERMQMQREQMASRQQVAGAGKGNGVTPMSDEDKAMAAGMSLPEMQKLRDANRSGDFGGYATPDNYVMEEGEAPKSVKPKAQAYIAEKRKILAEIAQEQSYGNEYKGVAEARKTNLETGIMGDVRDGKMAAEKGAQIVSVGKGSDQYAGGESTSTNKFTGKQTINAIGQSKIVENGASAGLSNAKSKREVTGARDDTLKGIEELRKSATVEVQTAKGDLAAFDKENPGVQFLDPDKTSDAKGKAKLERRRQLTEAKEEALAALRDVTKKTNAHLDGKAGGKAAAQPAPAAAPKPGKDNAKPQSPYPEGTRLKGKDGKTYVVRNGAPKLE